MPSTVKSIAAPSCTCGRDGLADPRRDLHIVTHHVSACAETVTREPLPTGANVNWTPSLADRVWCIGLAGGPILAQVMAAPTHAAEFGVRFLPGQAAPWTWLRMVDRNLSWWPEGTCPVHQ